MAKSEKIKPSEKFGEIMDFLDMYDTTVYTGSDEGYDYLENGEYCVEVSSPSDGDALFIDIEHSGFSIAYGDYEGHYRATAQDFKHMIDDLGKFMDGKMYLAVVLYKEMWICSLSVDQPKVDRRYLIHQTADFLRSADAEAFVKQIRDGGADIDCLWWDPSKNSTVSVRPGEMK